ncbi:MAG: flagellar biosynthetic protein FliO [Terracidiphilus sp.]
MLARLRAGRRPQPRLALLERIALAPRQSLALVEAEGRRFLVATSPEGAPAFYPLDEQRRGSITRFPAKLPQSSAGGSARVSW